MKPDIEEIIIDPAAAGSVMARRITDALPGVAPRVARLPVGVKDAAPLKKTLYVTNHRGKLLKPCPGTAGYLCCGYRVLNLVTGCPLDCTYCILQLYLNRPCLTVHANWEDSLAEVEAFMTQHPGRILRLGTGELADSLALEPLTGMARELLGELITRRDLFLELKTKTTNIENLLDLDPRGRALVSWSLNAPRIAAADERGAPPVEERLRAAAEARRAGFRIGLHFDPLIRFDGWERGYSRAVEAIYDHLAPGDIAWISLGALRYPPALDGIIRRRFPDSRLPLGELVPGLDGKLRYFRPLRVEMFRHLHGEILRRDGQVEVYLCMESPQIWEEALGRSPRGSTALSHCLDRAALAM